MNRFRECLALAQKGSSEALKELDEMENVVECGLRELKANELPQEQLLVIPHLMLRVLGNCEKTDAEFFEPLVKMIVDLLVEPTAVVYECVEVLSLVFRLCFVHWKCSLHPVVEFAEKQLKGDDGQREYGFHLLKVCCCDYPSADERDKKFIVSTILDTITVEQIVSGKMVKVYEIVGVCLSCALSVWWDLVVSDETITRVLSAVIGLCEYVDSMEQCVDDNVRESVSLVFEIVPRLLALNPLYKPAQEARICEIQGSSLFQNYLVHVLKSIPNFVRVFVTDIHLRLATYMLDLTRHHFNRLLESGVFQDEHREMLLKSILASSELSPNMIRDFVENTAVFYSSAFLDGARELRTAACSFISQLPESWDMHVLSFLMKARPSEGRIRLTASLCARWPERGQLLDATERALSHLVAAVLTQDVEGAAPAIVQYSRVFLLAEQIWLCPEEVVDQALKFVADQNLLSAGEKLEETDPVKFTLGCKILLASTKRGRILSVDVMQNMIERRQFCLSTDVCSLMAQACDVFGDSPDTISAIIAIFFDNIIQIEANKDEFLSHIDESNLRQSYRAIWQIYQTLGVIINPEQFQAFWQQLLEIYQDVDPALYDFVRGLCEIGVEGMWPILRTFPEVEKRLGTTLECEMEQVRATVLFYLSRYREEPVGNDFKEFINYYFECFKQFNVEEPIDCYILGEITAVMLQQKWLDAFCLPVIIDFAKDILLQEDPIDDPADLAVAFDLLMSANLFYDVNVFDDHFISVWQRFVEHGGIFGTKAALLHKAFFTKMKGSIGDTALALLSIERPPNPNIPDSVLQLGTVPCPPKLVALL